MSKNEAQANSSRRQIKIVMRFFLCDSLTLVSQNVDSFCVLLSYFHLLFRPAFLFSQTFVCSPRGEIQPRNQYYPLCSQPEEEFFNLLFFLLNNYFRLTTHLISWNGEEGIVLLFCSHTFSRLSIACQSPMKETHTHTYTYTTEPRGVLPVCD